MMPWLQAIKGKKVQEFCTRQDSSLLLLFSCLCCEFCWKEGGTLFKDLNWVWYSSCRGKLTGGLLICCSAFGLGICPGPFHLGTCNYKFAFSLANSFSMWNRSLFDNHRKYTLLIVEGAWEPSASTSDFTDGRGPKRGMTWLRQHKESVSGADSTKSDTVLKVKVLTLFFPVHYLFNIISNIYWAPTIRQILFSCFISNTLKLCL